MAEAKIVFSNVCKNFVDLKALDNISLEIPSGSIFGIVGQSGAGKSTLLRTLNRLEDIDSGDIYVDGVDILKLNGKDLRDYRKKVAMIFQSFALLETKNVFDNIALPLKCNGYTKLQIKERVEELSKIVGLEDKLKNRPRELSGGQKQRVAIARALALNPDMILCDEATSALDPITTQSILDLLKKINKELNITVVIVTHQMEVVKAVCDEIAILKNGKLIEKGKTAEIFLSSNSALKTLVTEEEIIPETGVNIKLYFSEAGAEQTLITNMAIDLNVNFSIVWGKLEKFKDDVLGSLIINVKEKDLNNVINFLNDRKVGFEVIRKEID